MKISEFARRMAGGQREARAEPPPLFDLFSGARYGWGARSASTVAYDSAQAHGAVYACVDLLVRLVAWQMPVSVSGRSSAPSSIVSNPHPEPQMLAEHWRAQALESAALRGYAAGLVTSRESTGWPRQIMPLHPDCVTWYVDPRSGRTEWRAEGAEVGLWQEGGELWLAPSPRVTPGSPVGKSVLAHAAQQINLGLGARKFGQDFFDASGLPVVQGKILDEPNITQAQAEPLKRRLMDVTRNREPLITGSNFELTTIPINAEESQFLQTIQANVAQVCMFFGIPPESIGGTSGDSNTYANVEGRNLSLLTNTVGAWMQWMERVMSALLPRSQLVDLDPKALLRTSTSVNFDNSMKGIGQNTVGFMKVDEARVNVGLPPLGGVEGNRLYVPVNYAPSDLIDQVVAPDQGMVGNGEQAPAA